MLGIVIGVAAVIAMIALGNGAENAVKNRIARLGTTVLQINPQRVNQGGIGTTTSAEADDGGRRAHSTPRAACLRR